MSTPSRKNTVAWFMRYAENMQALASDHSQVMLPLRISRREAKRRIKAMMDRLMLSKTRRAAS